MLTEAIHNLPAAILEGIRIRRDAAIKVATNVADDKIQAAPPTVQPSPAPSTKEDASDMIQSTQLATQNVGVALFQRSQTEDEIQAELKRPTRD